MNFISDFYEHGYLDKCLNTSFVALIPKNNNPCILSDYRPISLINSVYKILAKVLANRLKLVDTLINSNQSAFISGRQIMDGFLIANELVDSVKKSKTKGLLLKVDFKKAFDCVDWSFLMFIMEKMGFGIKWKNWIFQCISTAIVNLSKWLTN